MDYPKSLPDVYLHDGKFTDGTADGSISPSRDPAKWANDVTDTLLLVQAWTGEAPNEADLTQLKRGIDARIDAAIAEINIPETDLTPYARLGTVQDWTALQSCTVAILPDAVTIAWDLSHAQMAQVTIAASRTLALPTNMRAGARAELTVVHGAAGTTLSFAPGYSGIAGLALSTGAGAVDVLTWHCTGTSMRLVGVALNVGG